MRFARTVILRIYELALLAFPRAFRHENASEILDTIRSRARDRSARRGTLNLMRFWATELFAVVRSGIGMRISSKASHSRRRGDSVLVSIAQDVRFAFRSYRKTPALTVVVILTLGIGIGANAAVLPFLYGMLVRPLPFEEPERLAVLYENSPRFTRGTPSYPNFVDWRERSTTFEEMGAYRGTRGTLTGAGDPELLLGCQVSYDLFSVLGVRPALGRLFLPEDDVPGAPATILLGHGLWTRRFGADDGLIGRSLNLEGELRTVVGIMPAGFQFPDHVEYWIPFRRSTTAGRRSSAGEVIGRLSRDATLARAQNEMSAIAAQLGEEYPPTNSQRGVVVRQLTDDILWGKRRPILIFYAVACIVLLLACANVTNLLLARSTARSREIAMRSVLGASRTRIARQLVTECLLLALIGGALGLIVGNWGRSVALAALVNPLPYYFEFEIGLPVILATFGTTLLAGVLFSIAPAVGARSIDLSPATREGDSYHQGARRSSRLRSVLVISEIGLALVVLVGAGLLTRSFLSLTAVDAGFEANNLLTVQISLPRDRYDDASDQQQFFRELRERIASVAGVVGVSGVSNLPMTGSHQRTTIYAEHSPIPAQGEEDHSLNRQISPDYFEVMGIPLLTGRDFEDAGALPDGPPLVVVDQALASHLWPSENAVGKRIKYGTADDTRWPWMEVIGIVGNTHHFSLDDHLEKGMYRPFSQEPYRRHTVVIRSAGDPTLLADQIRSEIWSVDPDLPLDGLRTMESVVRESYWERSAQMWLLGALSAIAIVLAAFGVYGVVAYSVGQRTWEFGIRMALGAERLEIGKLVASQVGSLAAVGLAAGIAVALAVTRFGSALLFEVRYSDPPTYITAVFGMVAVILIAGFVPACRAAQLDPAASLRTE